MEKTPEKRVIKLLSTDSISGVIELRRAGLFRRTKRDVGMSTTETSAPALKGAPIEPLAVTIGDAVRFSGMSRSEIYRRATAGDLVMVKNGARSLVLVASIRDLIANLPRATLRAPKDAP